MRRSLTISLLAHAAILASAFIVLPNPKEFKVEDQESIPIDIITTEDLSKRQAMVKTPEKPVEKAAPKPVDVVKPLQPAPEVEHRSLEEYDQYCGTFAAREVSA